MAESLGDRLRQLAREVSGIPGTLAMFLFGSYVRGEQHEGGDIDLLVLFNDEAMLMSGRAQLTQITAQCGLFVHPICLTSAELERSPLLSTILREGEILYQHASFSLEAMALKRLRPYALITYDLRSLAPKEKVKVIYALQGRGKGAHRYPGLLDRLAGCKVGHDTLLIPFRRVGEAYRFFEGIDAPYTTRYVWMMEPDGTSGHASVSYWRPIG